MNLVELHVVLRHIIRQERIALSGFPKHTGGINRFIGTSVELGKHKITIIVQAELVDIVGVFIHGQNKTGTVEQAQVIVEQNCADDEFRFVPGVDLKYHQVRMIFTDDGRINFIVSTESDVRSVEGNN